MILLRFILPFLKIEIGWYADKKGPEAHTKSIKTNVFMDKVFKKGMQEMRNKFDDTFLL